MAASDTQLCFVRLGHMGGGMAARLLAAGQTVYGKERSREHAEPLIDEGLQWRESPPEVAQAANIVLSSLPDDRVLHSPARERITA